MGIVLALFIVAYTLLIKHYKTGYWLMILFLSMEFLFYLSSALISVSYGHRLFFQLYNPDPILWTVFDIGYLNLFASAYFLFFLFCRKNYLISNDIH